MYYFSGMKNIQGKEESLKLFNDKGGLIYGFYETYNGRWIEITFDDKGNELTFKSSTGYWSERTYDDQGKELTFKDSEGKLRGFDIPEYTMEELTKIVGKEFKIKK